MTPEPLEYSFPVDQPGDLTVAQLAGHLTAIAAEPGMGDAVVRLLDPSGTYWDTTPGARSHGVTDGSTGDTLMVFGLVPARRHRSFDHQLVDQLLDRIFELAPRHRHTDRALVALKAWAAEHGSTGILDLFADLSTVYAQSPQRYVEQIRQAVMFWDDPEQAIDTFHQCRFLHGKGMAPFNNPFDKLSTRDGI